ncbi:DUF2184 domain-containing protein [Sphingomonas montanisoli]|uniref:DUF2184 domain-containing protein n=1 Tax=Sphingomonas montanisoli TaxID=2606412 RepID=A0A5D9C2U9_9SPHN|nr:DUF2184 domain-containing protein [Sphingomonas montanisoli]TZG25587.1 DUF2184 domain-containing protein [Sphingomonas montanisoli]
MQFLDAATGKIDFRAWKAHDDQFVDGFRDKVDQFYTNDQIGIAFLTPQLWRIESEVYSRKYPNFELTGLIEVNEDGDMWDIGTVFYSRDMVGRAEFLSGKGMDMPYVGSLNEQNVRGFHLAGIGYEYSVQEMQRAAKMGRSLDSEKASDATMVAKVFKRSVAMTGRTPGAAVSEKGWTGLINDPNVPTANVAATGTGSTTPWANKTPDQISADIWGAVNAVETQTAETHTATTVALPTAKLRYIEQTRMTDGSGRIIDFIRGDRSAGGRSIEFTNIRELAGAGASSTDRMMAWDNSKEVARFHLPGDHTFLEPRRAHDMLFSVGGVMNVGGTEIRLPKAVVYRDGI